MNAKRSLPLVPLVGAMVVAVAVFAAIDRVAPGETASAVLAAGQPAAVTPAIRATVRHAGGPGSPVANGAEANVQHLFTPADRRLPAFFRIPMKDGGACIVTSATVISSCLRADSTLAGTITVADDSESDTIPPFVYGLVRANVRSVRISLGTGSYPAALSNGFFVFRLPGATARVDDVRAVLFELANGSAVRRVIG